MLSAPVLLLYLEPVPVRVPGVRASTAVPVPVSVPVPVVGKVQTGNVLRYVGVPEEEDRRRRQKTEWVWSQRGKRELEGKEGESPRAAPWPLRWLERGLID